MNRWTMLNIIGIEILLGAATLSNLFNLKLIIKHRQACIPFCVQYTDNITLSLYPFYSHSFSLSLSLSLIYLSTFLSPAKYKTVTENSPLCHRRRRQFVFMGFSTLHAKRVDVSTFQIFLRQATTNDKLNAKRSLSRTAGTHT